MRSPTDSSSRYYIPGSRAELSVLKWQREQAQRDRREAFDVLNAFVTRHGGWITSLPTASPVTVECLVDSTLPSELERRGYELSPASPPSGERILPAAMSELVLIEGSTRSTIRTTHAGICKVLRYVFPL